MAESGGCDMSSGYVPYPQPTAPSMPPCYSALTILKIIESEDPMLYRDMVFVIQRHAAKTPEFQHAQMLRISECR